MALHVHNISLPNDGLGDPLRAAFDAQNEMNAELYEIKVDKIPGKGLSSNDFTNDLKTKLENLDENAEQNIQADWSQTDSLADDFIKNKPDQSEFGVQNLTSVLNYGDREIKFINADEVEDNIYIFEESDKKRHIILIGDTNLVLKYISGTLLDAAVLKVSNFNNGKTTYDLTGIELLNDGVPDFLPRESTVYIKKTVFESNEYVFLTHQLHYNDLTSVLKSGDRRAISIPMDGDGSITIGETSAFYHYFITGSGNNISINLNENICQKSAELKITIESNNVSFALGSGVSIIGDYSAFPFNSTATLKQVELNVWAISFSGKLITQDDLDLKLDASAYNDRWKGKYTSLALLESAHPTANSGDYAQIDEGTGFDVVNYSYDVEDGWVEGGSGSGATDTDALPEGATNLYHTSARVLATVLAGLSLATGTAITSADSILVALGKAQKQINDIIANVSSNSAAIATNTANIATNTTAITALQTSQIIITTAVNITTATTDGTYGQSGRNTVIDNGANAINLTVNGLTGSGSYLKTGSAAVTFVQGAGRTLVQVSGTDVMNGAAGSTATITTVGTTDYLRISNV